ncbi:hypothetical protein HID58_047080 [Brassica napus]|uniref:Uncharacterized protein n=1 Tax=Brassica napus TaxID=3708 RepID=A0ABQ8AY97_BRANA|nr:hypothetical protein HID58_047080 [Brassica napus]
MNGTFLLSLSKSFNLLSLLKSCIMAPKGRDEEVDGLGPTPVPEIEVASMDFTIQDITHTHLSATWDLLTRIPDTLPDTYNVFKETFKLPCFTRILPLLSPLDTEDIGGLIGKNIIKDIKEKKEVKFGSQLFLTDCREKSTGVMRYACGETTLRFEPGSETKATSFGNKNNPTCFARLYRGFYHNRYSDIAKKLVILQLVALKPSEDNLYHYLVDKIPAMSHQNCIKRTERSTHSIYHYHITKLKKGQQDMFLFHIFVEINVEPLTYTNVQISNQHLHIKWDGLFKISDMKEVMNSTLIV